jgi:hypothetical protein
MWLATSGKAAKCTVSQRPPEARALVLREVIFKTTPQEVCMLQQLVYTQRGIRQVADLFWCFRE